MIMLNIVVINWLLLEILLVLLIPKNLGQLKKQENRVAGAICVLLATQSLAAVAQTLQFLAEKNSLEN